MIDDTVRVEIEGPAIATNVAAGVDSPPGPAASEDSADVRGAKRRISLAEANFERIQDAISRLAAHSVIAEDPSDDPPAAWDAVVAARRSVVAQRAARELELGASAAAARRELEESRRALAAALDRDRRTGSARPAKHHELRKHLDIELVATGPAAPVTIHIEYLVAAARWAPSYVARIEGERARVEIRAVVAQDTGEDWTSVPLRLSTAEPTRFAQLPELAAQRIGRRQQDPARTGFRSPPVGADALFADYDRDVRPLRRTAERTVDAREGKPRGGEAYELDRLASAGEDKPSPLTELAGSAYASTRTGGLAQEVWDEQSSAPKEAFSTPPMGSMMPMQAPASAPARGSGGRANKSAMAPSPDKAYDARPQTKPEPAREPVAQLDYANLVMAAPSSAMRGRLVPAGTDGHRHAIDSVVEPGRARIVGLPLPPGCTAEWSHTYDYAFATDGAVDVRSDGAWHSIAVTASTSTAKLLHVAVPREQADVFRIAAIANPFAGPLLPGPIDVYDRGRFLVTSTVDYAPPNAAVEIGLGVDAAVKIARNTEFREEAAGMLRGVLLLHHAIAIDIENVSGRVVELEVRERVPVAREGEDDIEVRINRIDPAWERWTPDADTPRARRLRNGYRWRLVVPAGAKRTLRAAYEVKIPGKSELVGGNRRES